MRKAITVILGLFVVSLCNITPAIAQDLSHGLIVKLPTETTVQEFLTENNYTEDQIEIGRDGFLLLKTTEMPSEEQDNIRSRGVRNNFGLLGVESVEVNAIDQPLASPNDPRYTLGEQWNLENIGMESAWDKTTGSQDVIVAVLDTGYYKEHEDFENLVWTNPGEIAGNGIDDDNNGLIDDVNGYNFVAENNSTSDLWGHGTMVGSIIAAKTNNNKGMAGINWQVKIMPVKVCEVGANCPVYDQTQGIYYAVDNGAKVINMSIGGYNNVSYRHEAIQYAQAHGVQIVAASGNNDSAVCYPARHEEVIAVGAVNSNDERASFSNYGPELDIVAPGLSTFVATKDNSYTTASGTSFASPHVAGAVALLMSYDNTLTISEIRSYLNDNADTVAGMSGANWTQYYGNGRLNVDAALSQIGNFGNPNIDGIHEAEYLYHQIGSVIDDSQASNGKAVVAAVGNGPGHIQYGPYVGYDATNKMYVAKYRLKTDDNTYSGSVAQIEVFNTANLSETKYANIKGTDFDQPDTYQDFYIKFNKNQSGLLEYRVYSFGHTDITSDRVEVVETGGDASERYESEDAHRNVGRVVEGGNYSERLAVSVKANEIGFAQYGPYVTNLTDNYKYRAVFRLSASANNTSDEIVQIEVINHTHPELNAIRRIEADDFAHPNAVESFGLDFTVQNNDLLEYRVLNLGNSHDIDVVIDMVQINYDDNFWVRNYEAEDLYSQVGDMAAESAYSNQKARRASVANDSEGFLVYGPYANNLDDNANYYAVFRLKTNNNITDQKVARIEISNPGGNARYVGRDLTGNMFAAANTWQDFTLHFNRGAGGSLEYRVYFYDNHSDLLVDNIKIINKNENYITYEAEDMYVGQGETRWDSYNQSVYIKSEKEEGAGHIVYGPYTKDQSPGRYRVTFKIKNEGSASGELVRIDAVNVDGDGQYAFKDLYQNDFGINNFGSHTLEFSRSASGNMEYRVYTYGRTDISVDKIVVERIGD